MANRLVQSLFCVVLLIISFTSVSFADNQKIDFWSESDEDNAAFIDHQLWQGLLDQYLIDGHATGVNRFSYDAVSSESKQQLDRYLKQIQTVDPLKYSKQEQKAYWINLYNALTVNIILEKKPVFSIMTTGNKLFSKGPWNDLVVVVNDRPLSLNNIEHDILRPIWKDYRIHFAVNCASIGCPNLQGLAYTRDNLEQLLHKGAIEFLSHPRGFFLEKNRLDLSSIFDWYQSDFGVNEQAMLVTLSKYLPEETAQKIKSFNGRIKYSYNWLLNSP